MSPASNEAYDKVVESINTEGKDLRGTDWFEFLEELSGHIECMIDCYKEENPEEFE